MHVYVAIFCSSITLAFIDTIYDQIDEAATINFSMQFGAATIQERCLFESGVYYLRHRYGLERNSVTKVNTSTRIVY